MYMYMYNVPYALFNYFILIPPLSSFVPLPSPPYQSVSDVPLVTLYGHDHEVLCVDISTELDTVVSGDKVMNTYNLLF